MIEIVKFIELDATNKALELEKLSKEIVEKENNLFTTKITRLNYSEKEQNTIDIIKSSIAQEKGDDGKKKFSNDLEREIELKKRYDLSMYATQLRSYDVQINEKEVEVNHLKRIFDICMNSL
jgi:hypothetical protein